MGRQRRREGASHAPKVAPKSARGPGHAQRVAPKKARGPGQEADAASHAPRVAPRVAPSLEVPRAVQSRENRPLASDPIRSRPTRSKHTASDLTPEAFQRARKNANLNREEKAFNLSDDAE